MLTSPLVNKEKINLYLFLFFLGTIFNIVLCLYLKNPFVFFMREIFLTGFLFLHYYFSEEIAIFSKEDAFIHQTLSRKYPILRFRLPALLCFTLSIIVFPYLPFYNNDYPILFPLVLALGFPYLGLSFYAIICIWNTPELSDFYNIKKSIKLHGLRSFSTTSKVVHGGKVVVQAGVTILGAGIYGHKLLETNFDARGPVQRFLDKNLSVFPGVTYLDSHRRAYYEVCARDFEAGQLLLRENGDVDIKRMEAYYQKNDLTPPIGFTLNTKHEVTHHFDLGLGLGISRIRDWWSRPPKS